MKIVSRDIIGTSRQRTWREDDLQLWIIKGFTDNFHLGHTILSTCKKIIPAFKAKNNFKWEQTARHLIQVQEDVDVEKNTWKENILNWRRPSMQKIRISG
jgi:hypothetical protein